MPVRPRRQRRHKLALDLERMLALTIGPTPTLPGARPMLDDDVLRALWAEHGQRILAGQRPGARPYGYWMFEPGVAEDLRRERPRLTPVEDAERDRTAEKDLEVRRAAWLADQDH